eukprot:4319794-Amphidinium_carterae.2
MQSLDAQNGVSQEPNSSSSAGRAAQGHAAAGLQLASRWTCLEVCVKVALKSEFVVRFVYPAPKPSYKETDYRGALCWLPWREAETFVADLSAKAGSAYPEHSDGMSETET